MIKSIKIKKLFLHIGSHKTGTTYLQKFFHENKKTSDHPFFLYPKNGCGDLYGHHEIINSIRTSKSKLYQLINSISKEVDKSHDTILLSSENFEYLTPIEIKELLSFFDTESVSVIYLYRNWTSLLYSMWQEEIKHGSTLFFENYSLRHITYPWSSKLLNFSIPIDNYASIVGHDNIVIASYDMLSKIDIVDFFCNIIGIKKDTDSSYPERINSSFDPCLVEIIRVMNQFAKNEKYEKSYLPKHYYINNARGKMNGLTREKEIRDVMNKHLGNTHDFMLSYAFKIIYKNFFEKYRDRFIDDLDDMKILLKNNFIIPKVVSPNYIFNSKIIEHLNDAWNDVRECLPK